MDVITLSSTKGMLELIEKRFDYKIMFPNMEKNRAKEFDKNMKKYVFITARVHPGETPGSHSFNGMIKFLLSCDRRATILMDNFVFVMIPMLNPDGVYRGHYRVDTLGNNLNRYYNAINYTSCPTIYAAKQLFINLNNQGKLFFYCDMHAHAARKGIFIFGNCLEFKKQIECMLFIRLLSLNHEHFDYKQCNFSLSNMSRKDKGIS